MLIVARADIRDVAGNREGRVHAALANARVADDLATLETICDEAIASGLALIGALGRLLPTEAEVERWNHSRL